MGRARDRASADLNGQEFILDADADTSISADTDDQIDIKIAGADDFQFTANTFTVKSGSTIVVDDTTDSTSTTTGSIQTDGGVGIAKDLVVGDDILLKSDSAALQFGADADITLTHVADQGLTLKSTATDGASGLGPILNLSTGDTDIAEANQLGTINFQAPNEGTGTDAILVAASITAIANEAFAADANGTSLILRTSDSGTNDGGYLEIVNDGRVRIKQNNPGGKIRLEMGQTGVANTDVTGEIEFYHNDSAGAGVNANIKGICTDSNGKGAIVFGTGTTSTTERFRIDGDGTTVFRHDGATTTLQFLDSSNSDATVFVLVPAVYNGGVNKFSSFNTTSISLNPQNSEALLLGTDGSMRLQHVYDDTTSNSANMYIHSDGTHQVMRSTSSERYKKDIETLEDKYADAVLGLRPVWYKSKCEADNPDYSHWGLIAEEVAKVDPRLVTFRNEITTSKDDPITNATITKTTKLDTPQAESVQYDRFVPHLINICKRQEDKITALEAKVKTLEEA